MTDDLVAFLSARLDEDEAAAKRAFRSVLVAKDYHVFAPAHPGVPELPVADAVDAETATHIARHDPARALREVATKRAVAARHKPLQGMCGLCCAWCSDDVDIAWLNMPWPCEDVRDLAAVWSDHPDYRQEWSEGTLGAHDDEP